MSPTTSVSSRSLSSMENLWMKALDLGTGCAVIGFHFNLKLAISHVKDAAVATARSYPIIAASIFTGSNKVENVLKLPSSADSYSVPVESLPWPLDNNQFGHLNLTDLHRIVELEFGIPFSTDPSEIPVSQIHLYLRDGYSFLVLRLHGSVLDRSSGVAISDILLQNLNALVQGKAAAVPEPYQLGLPAPAMDLIPKGVGKKGILARGLDSVGYIASALKLALLPFQAGCSDFRKHSFVTQFVSFELSEENTQALLETCNREGVTLFGVESAAIVKSVASFKKLGSKKEEYGVTSVINVRKYLEPAQAGGAAGLYNMALPLTCKVSESTPFWDVARQLSATAEENIAKNKMFSEMTVLDSLFSYALNHPALTPDASLRTALCSVFTDAPQDATWKYSDHLNLVESQGPFVSMHGVGPCVALLDTLQGKKLKVTLVYTSPLFSRDTILTLSEKMQALVIEAIGRQV